VFGMMMQFLGTTRHPAVHYKNVLLSSSTCGYAMLFITHARCKRQCSGFSVQCLAFCLQPSAWNGLVV